ncbi:hypothetical protein ACIG8S_04580 [[Kitasatospora] papulosa]
MVGLASQTLVAGYLFRSKDSAAKVVLVDAVQDLPCQLAVIQVPHAVRLQ